MRYNRHFYKYYINLNINIRNNVTVKSRIPNLPIAYLFFDIIHSRYPFPYTYAYPIYLYEGNEN